MKVLQGASNPALAPFAKMAYIIRERAKALDLDPEKVTNDIREAAVQAELMKGFKQELPQPQPEGQPQAPAGADAMDMTGAGGGTIGIGQVPQPQEQGFSGNGQAATQPPQADGQQQGNVGPLQ